MIACLARTLTCTYARTLQRPERLLRGAPGGGHPGDVDPVDGQGAIEAADDAAAALNAHRGRAVGKGVGC